MKIIDLKTNHISNPLGFHFNNYLTFSYKVIEATGKNQVAAQIQVALSPAFEDILYDTGRDENLSSLGHLCNLKLTPRSRYYWRVKVWADNGDVSTSDVAWFETAKMNEEWTGTWITPDLSPEIHPELVKNIKITKKVEQARVYICGLGLYEMYINDTKVGNEYLAPFNNDYDNWIQYQTYDITDSFSNGENKINVLLGNGWYKGRFGFEGGHENIYGDRFALLAELHLSYEDGTTEIISTDTSWDAHKSKILVSEIYDGEIYDDTFSDQEKYAVNKIDLGNDRLTARLSLPVIIKEKLNPVEIIDTPAGEKVIDMGQNMVGWIEFTNRLPKGGKVTLQYGEILQDGNFYRENLREAKAEFTYISDGEEKTVRPHFTFYGFRYVKVSGWQGELDINDFIGCVIYSDLAQTGFIETSNSLVNKLFENVMWSQKGNFLDIPTDCPQRDERMGWTGDAQVFSGTAAYNMNVYSFFTKYGYDVWLEQKVRNGAVPMTVPEIPSPFKPETSSSAWGDAATIIPWNMYLFYGDDSILKQQFQSMKAWVDYIKQLDEESGGHRLWRNGFHFGDWLALDGENPKLPMGGTDKYFIASAYYYYSADIVSKAASVLGKVEVEREYKKLAEDIRNAIQNEYISPNGRITIDTQTAYVLALFMDLVSEDHKQRVADDLANCFMKDNKHLKTGFVGTPYICQVLSKYGHNDLAYTLLLNEDYPSWLYAIKLGATTVWERWNSVMPDGKMNPEGMNSLNHYAYGSIAEWMYRYMVGINPDETKPGFKHAIIAPKPHWRMKWVKGNMNTASGNYYVSWQIQENGLLDIKVEIPFNSTATLILPDATKQLVSIVGDEVEMIQQENEVIIELNSGTWQFTYLPTTSYVKEFTRHTKLKELLDIPPIKEIVLKEVPEIRSIPPYLLDQYEPKTLEEILDKGDSKLATNRLEKVEELFQFVTN
ncbi:MULTISPECIES: alpha-L-rhamnosidase [Metabacillus]|uniref:alpha-L-rhamnosidase n=1 Tax=Metabacillus TaxID=2675233 RepID=UPI00082EF4AF|nr:MULTISPECIES: alpha-L-rhamnosidase [Metabacillus]